MLLTEDKVFQTWEQAKTTMQRFNLLAGLALLQTCLGVGPKLSPHQQMLGDVWDEHLRFEFQDKSVDNTMATMVDHGQLFVQHVPTMTGGVGKEQLTQFYASHFIFQNPDMDIRPVSRTIGHDQIVDEMVITLVHDRRVSWLLPSTPPTGRTIKVALVVIIKLAEEDGTWKLESERIYWDQATVLVQAGLLDKHAYDVTGVEQAEQVLDVTSHPMNKLLTRREQPSKGEL